MFGSAAANGSAVGRNIQPNRFPDGMGDRGNVGGTFTNRGDIDSPGAEAVKIIHAHAFLAENRADSCSCRRTATHLVFLTQQSHRPVRNFRALRNRHDSQQRFLDIEGADFEVIKENRAAPQLLQQCIASLSLRTPVESDQFGHRHARLRIQPGAAHRLQPPAPRWLRRKRDCTTSYFPAPVGPG
jgi:hypothetical protein